MIACASENPEIIWELEVGVGKETYASVMIWGPVLWISACRITTRSAWRTVHRWITPRIPVRRFPDYSNGGSTAWSVFIRFTGWPWYINNFLGKIKKFKLKKYNKCSWIRKSSQLGLIPLCSSTVVLYN